MADKLTDKQADLLERATGAIHTMVMAEALMRGTGPLLHIPSEREAIEGMVHALDTLAFADDTYPGATPMEASTDLFLACTRLIRRPSTQFMEYGGILVLARRRAEKNVAKWGLQNWSTLWLAMIEELGEIAKAHLQSSNEGADRARVIDECMDLAALCVQYVAKVLADRDVAIDAAEAEEGGEG